MEDIEISISNYRNIPYDNPLTITLGKGITIILGVNNIGKSNLLKLFFELRSVLDYSKISPKNQHGFNGGLFYSHIKNQTSSHEGIHLTFSQGGQPFLKLKILPPESSHLDVGAFKLDVSYGSEYNAPFFEKIFAEVNKIFKDSMYVGTFRTPTFQTTAGYYDMEIGHSFIKRWDEWANGPNTSQRNKIRVLKEELRELFGFNHFNIVPNNGNTNFIVDTDDGSFQLDELGGGISHYVLVLGNALMREPSFILIDEPEIGLHPKMQEAFVRTLAAKAKLGLIATSHSVGLARSVGSDRIYSLTKDKNGRLKLSRYGDHYKLHLIDAINELGYSQFVEIGGNNILLVEGAGDIKSFKEILSKYGIEHHFIIWHLGGANMISASRLEELSELKRLNAKSYNVIFDSEIGAEGEELKEKLKEFKVMCEDIGFNVFPTEFHSTDNYITKEAIDKVDGGGYTALGKYENLNLRPAQNKWGKSLNWKMFREMKKKDFAGTKLDKFITEILMPLTK